MMVMVMWRRLLQQCHHRVDDDSACTIGTIGTVGTIDIIGTVGTIVGTVDMVDMI